MKFIVVIAFLIAFVCASSLKTNFKDNSIELDLDLSKDSPIGFAMKGRVDPKNEQRNQIQTFLRLAGEYIPILAAYNSEDNNLEYFRAMYFQIGDTIEIEIQLYFQLLVGWRVEPGRTSDKGFEVTYTPFALGSTRTSMKVTSWPGIVESGVHATYLNVSAPINLSILDLGKFCLSSTYTVRPGIVNFRFNSSLKQCEDEIIESILYGQRWLDITCSYNTPVDFVFANKILYSGISGDITGEQCFDIF